MNEKEAFIKSGLIEEYVLGLSNARDKAKVEQMAEQYAEVADLLGKTRQAMDQYCRHAREGHTPGIKNRLYNAMHSESRQRDGTVRSLSTNQQHRARWNATTPLAIALSILAITIAGVTMGKNAKLKRDLFASKSATDEMMSRMNNLMSKHKEMQQQITFLQDLDTDQIMLNDLSNERTETIAVVYCNLVKQEALMHIINLPKSPFGMTYQLWAKVKGDIRNMGTISTDQEWVSLPFMRHTESLSITLERNDGSSKPTLEKLVSTANTLPSGSL